MRKKKEGSTCYYSMRLDRKPAVEMPAIPTSATTVSILLNVRDVHDIRIAQQQEKNRFRAILRETCEYIIRNGMWRQRAVPLHLPTLINRYPLEACSDYGSLIARYSNAMWLPGRESLPAGGLTPGSAEPYAQGRRLMLHQVHGEYQRLPGLQDMEHVPVPL